MHSIEYMFIGCIIIILKKFLHENFLVYFLGGQIARKKLKKRYQKVRQRFGGDFMVRPNYSVLDIEDSVRSKIMK